MRKTNKVRETLAFNVSGDVEVHADLHRKRVIICCVTQDGKALRLETDYETLGRFNREIQKQLENLLL